MIASLTMRLASRLHGLPLVPVGVENVARLPPPQSRLPARDGSALLGLAFPLHLLLVLLPPFELLFRDWLFVGLEFPLGDRLPHLLQGLCVLRLARGLACLALILVLGAALRIKSHGHLHPDDRILAEVCRLDGVCWRNRLVRCHLDKVRKLAIHIHLLAHGPHEVLEGRRTLEAVPEFDPPAE